MKFLMIAVVIYLALQGGAWRTRRLVSSVKGLRKDYENGRDRAADPAGHAKDVTPASTSSKSPDNAR
jgi:hypothetical protein